MGLEQFFGILSSMDHAEDLWMIGSIMFIVGAFVGAVIVHVLESWK